MLYGQGGPKNAEKAKELLGKVCMANWNDACLVFFKNFKKDDVVEANKMKNLGLKRNKECQEGIKASCPKTKIEH